MEGGLFNPRTVEEVFGDFKGRRNGLIKALTTGFLLLFFHVSVFALSLSLFFFCFNRPDFIVLLFLLQKLKTFTSSAILVRVFPV